MGPPAPSSFTSGLARAAHLRLFCLLSLRHSLTSTSASLLHITTDWDISSDSICIFPISPVTRLGLASRIVILLLDYICIDMGDISLDSSLSCLELWTMD
ncbi:hypothetical protein BC629DRAFT_1543833 [Irpex lacteus]|nr:hypothetical protein BC629DRAFT_1543833 [Irpex lacteus]